MKNIACFDIGGTFIKYAVIDSDGNILFKDKFQTPRENCRNAIPEALSVRVKELQKKFDIYRIGISTAGQVDSEKGEITFATENIPGYTGAKLSKDIEDKTGLSTFVENDVNAAALGEMWKGAARDRSTFICITLGTGVGGAIVIDGKLYKGVKGSAGEVGHIIVNENGEKCTCGCSGCYERYASTSALIRSYKKAVEKEDGPDGEINGEFIMSQVYNGDKIALKVYDEFLNHIVTGIVNVTHLLDPGLIVIGGGISAQGKPFFDEIIKRFNQTAMKSYSEHTEIVQAVLQNDAGVYGACYTALQGK
jgi:Transcriptional regulator/sugar kinase